LIIAPNTKVPIEQERPVEHAFFHFRLGLPFDRMDRGVYLARLDRPLRRFFCGIAKKLRKGESPSPAVVLRSYGLILTVLSQGLPEEGPWPVALDPRLQTVLDRLEAHPEAIVSNPELARWIHMSTNGFVRLFTRSLGEGPRHYLIRLRASRVAERLAHSQTPIKALARELGFGDRTHLSKVFRRFFGLGPASYRRQARGASLQEGVTRS
jgi:AraC-like DNA-binding protein